MSLLSLFSSVSSEQTRAWYQALEKPFFAPPDWVFGLAWGGIYPLIGIAFVWTLVLWIRRQVPTSFVTVFFVNLAANAAYSPIQFALQDTLLASLDISIILGTLVYVWYAAWRSARVIAFLLLPYLVWVSFATLLQFSILYLNW